MPNSVGPVSALAVDGNVFRTDPEYLANPAVGNLGAFRSALAVRGVKVAGVVPMVLLIDDMKHRNAEYASWDY